MYAVTINKYGDASNFQIEKDIDTPKPKNVGTFVITVPFFEFTGGEFIIENRIVNNTGDKNGKCTSFY